MAERKKIRVRTNKVSNMNNSKQNNETEAYLREMFAKLERVPLVNLTSNQAKTVSLSKYTKEQIMKWLKAPETNADNLREVSNYLYIVSSQYRRLVNYYAKMFKFDYILIPSKMSDITTVKEKALMTSYKKAADYVETMNLHHEMQKASVVAWREDVFFGYIYKTNNSFTIKKLPPKYCKLSSIEDGCYLYAFDFSYFKTYPDDLIAFGKEFQDKYEIYLSNTTLYRWQELDAKNEFCLKVNEDLTYPMIPLAGCLEGIYDIEDYKDLQKAKTETGNYKALALNLPVNEKNGNLLLDYNLAKSFYTQLLQVLPDNIGAFITPMKVDDFTFEKSGTADTDKIAEAQKDYWNDTGVSSLLFGGDNQTSASLKISIKADEQLVFAFARQIERNVNRLLKYLSGTIKFKIQFLDVTYFNQVEMHNLYLKDAQSSFPTKTMTCASLGMSPTDVVSMAYFENQVLNFNNIFSPLNTSYTQSSKDTTTTQEVDGANVTAQGTELTDKGEESRERDVSENNDNSLGT